MTVPLVDLAAQHAEIRPELEKAIGSVLESGAFSSGPFVETFEEEFARWCGVPFAIGVGSGTDALWLALLAVGVGRGDEVITVSNSFFATAEAISMTGARPVFVDVNPGTYTMDVSKIEAALTRRTRVILPVHLYGQAADLEPILALARDRKIEVIEDACQAHGTVYKGRRAGTMGAAGCFSFYPGKNLGACGEAGMVVTARPEIAEQVRALRNHGQTRRHAHEWIGWNARMDGIQAAILSVKLRRLDEWNRRRRDLARQYTRALADLPGVVLPVEAPYGIHGYHIYAVRTNSRDDVLEDLRARGVQCAVHYPVPIHLQAPYRARGPRVELPVAERCARELLSLPLYPQITARQLAHVVRSLREALRRPHAA